MTTSTGFAPFAERMQGENLPDVFIRTFRYYYEQLVEGRTGLIPESDILPIDHLPDVETFPDSLAEIGNAALRADCHHQTQWRIGHQYGTHEGKIIADGEGWTDVPGYHRSPGAACRRAPASDGQLQHQRRFACRPTCLSRPLGRSPPRFPATQSARRSHSPISARPSGRKTPPSSGTRPATVTSTPPWSQVASSTSSWLPDIATHSCLTPTTWALCWTPKFLVISLNNNCRS